MLVAPARGPPKNHQQLQLAASRIEEPCQFRGIHQFGKSLNYSLCLDPTPNLNLAAPFPPGATSRHFTPHLPSLPPSLRQSPVMGLLENKFGVVFGVASKRSIAWAIAQAWSKAGAKLAFTYQGERLKENVEELAGTFGSETLILPCDVTKDEDIASVFKQVGEKFGKLHVMLHSVAFAPKEALEGDFIN